MRAGGGGTFFSSKTQPCGLRAGGFTHQQRASSPTRRRLGSHTPGEAQQQEVQTVETRRYVPGKEQRISIEITAFVLSALNNRCSDTAQWQTSVRYKQKRLTGKKALHMYTLKISPRRGKWGRGV
ncbi:hypothetical protein NDU88_008168 [Pleurodeles waltl]|uniref:Uncharacterized protein n=1 Tax=Pleurodeles waltl TaxID=8319 RepID=A0AAV7N8C9_PLEWA|nr:hypothetical protein NDU88_008168 [Pleurodeles waltl]